MTCKDCLHGDMCEGYIPTDLDRDVWHYCREGRADQIPDIEERCSSFKDSTNYVEVVRCKDCVHWIHMEDGFGDCTNNRFHLDGHADPTMKADDFCSCGKRRTDNGC